MARKIVRDLRSGAGRAAIVVLAIVVGLTAFAAVLSTYAVLRREINRGYLATNPASAVVVTDRIDDALLAAVRARADIADADARRIVTGRVTTPRGDVRRAVLFVVRDFSELRISTIVPEAGAWPPPAGTMLLERDAFQVAQARVGDVMTFEPRGGAGRAALRVAGRVHDAGQAQARMENVVYGYIAADTLAAIGGPAGFDRLCVIAAGDRFDAAHVQRVADDVKAWLEANGHPVARVDVPVPGEHPHAAIMGLLLMAMLAFGLIALALAGVIVINLMRSMIARERRQIGVMKAIGATRAQIARIHLAQAALLGAAATAVAMPAGIIGGRVMSRYFAVLLNFDLASLASPVWVFALVLLVGILVPIAAAAYPVAAGLDVTVREALAADDTGAPPFGGRRLDRVLSRITGPHRPLLLGVRNVARRPARAGLTIVTFAAAGACFMTAVSTRTSMLAAADRLYGAGTFGSEGRYAIDQHMLMIYVFLLIAAGVLASVGGLGLVTASSLNVLDRRRELGVLRAIGATPAVVSSIVVAESVALAAASWLIAWPGARLISAGIGRLFAVTIFNGRFDIVFPLAAPLAWLGMSMGLAVAASVVPAAGASRRSVREAVDYE